MDTPGSGARHAALAMLRAVLERRQPLQHHLDAAAGLKERDAAFARALASQTLRHLGFLEAVIRRCAPTPPPPHKAGPTSTILLMGTCELLVLRAAPHASVNGAVTLAAQDAKARHFKPLINAVLRRIVREGETLVMDLDRTRLPVPDWLWDRWQAQYGTDMTTKIAEAHLHEAQTDIVLKTPDAIHPAATHLFGQVHRLGPHERIATLDGFAQGDWWVQDAAATLPVHLLGDVQGEEVIDLCAAPGGKTMQLAALGARVTAVESDKARAERIRENLARTRLAAAIVVGDARDVPLKASRVLVDAPCTATGTIRRHPDLPWIKGADDVTQAAAHAAGILEAGAAMATEGGMLVFAVCSLEREEGEEQIEAFLSLHPEFARVPLQANDVFGHEEWITAQGDLRTLPFHLNGVDGFYAARLRKHPATRSTA